MNGKMMLVVTKTSGASYDDMTADDMVVGLETSIVV